MKSFTFKSTSLVACIYLLLCACNSYAQSTYLIFKATNSVAGTSQRLRDLTLERKGRDPVTIGTYGSYGKGISIQAGIGKMLNPTFGFELSGEFVYGRKIRTDFEENTADYDLRGYIKEKINTASLKPVIVIRNSGDLLSFYTKLGLILTFYTRKYEELEGVSLDHQTNESIILQTHSIESAKFKVGFTASFGVSFRVSESISLFGEVSGQIMSLPINKGHFTKYSINGKDLLPTMKDTDKNWRYEKSATDSGPVFANEEGIKLYNPANYTAIGLSAGLVFHL